LVYSSGTFSGDGVNGESWKCDTCGRHFQRTFRWNFHHEESKSWERAYHFSTDVLKEAKEFKRLYDAQQVLLEAKEVLNDKFHGPLEPDLQRLEEKMARVRRAALAFVSCGCQDLDVSSHKCPVCHGEGKVRAWVVVELPPPGPGTW
jgi:hypothetical protein